MKKNIFKLFGFLFLLVSLLSLFACSSQNTFTVTFSGNGGTLVSGKEVQKVKSSSDIKAPTYSYEGYDFVSWDVDLDSITSDATVNAVWEPYAPTYSIALYDGETLLEVVRIKEGHTVEITDPVKEGYVFDGWDKEVPEVMPNYDMSLTAKWTEVYNGDYTEFLDNISDNVTSDTVDTLTLKVSNATITYSCNKPVLYVIDNETGTAHTTRNQQRHYAQKATVTMTVNFRDNTKKTLTKDIVIDPVTFEDLPDTPIATYFGLGSTAAYMKYNTRYKTEKTFFSEETKETLDIVYMASVNVTSAGACSISTTTYISDLNELKNYNVRLIMSVEGVSSSSSKIFYDITQSDELTKKLATNLMNLVDKYNFDGLDLDWEYVSDSYPITKDAYTRLVKAIREEMASRQGANGTMYMLTAALPGSSWGTDTSRFDFKYLNEQLDYINVMSYDLNNPDKSTHLSNLYVSSYDNGYGFGCAYAVERFSSLGFDKSKLILGCAGYGKAYTVTGTVSSSSKYPGLGVAATLTKIDGLDGSFASGTLYGNAIQVLMNTDGYKQYVEYNKAGNVVGSYLYNATNKMFVTYDSAFVVKEKYKLANSIKGAGLMCWSYTEDTSDTVINAITEAIQESK